MPEPYTPTTDEVYQAIADAAPGWGLSEADDQAAFARWWATHPYPAPAQPEPELASPHADGGHWKPQADPTRYDRRAT